MMNEIIRQMDAFQKALEERARTADRDDVALLLGVTSMLAGALALAVNREAMERENRPSRRPLKARARRREYQDIG